MAHPELGVLRTRPAPSSVKWGRNWPPLSAKKWSIPLGFLILLQGCGSDRLFNPGDFQSLPRFQELPFSEIAPSYLTDYWELRHQPLDQPFEVIGSGGSLRKDQLPDSIRAAFDSTPAKAGFAPGCQPSYCYDYLTAVRDTMISTVQSSEELRQFLGFLNTETEALLLLHAEGFYWSADNKEAGAIRHVNGGFEVVVLKEVKSCLPTEVDRFLIRVESESGMVREVRADVWEYSKNLCTMTPRTRS